MSPGILPYFVPSISQTFPGWFYWYILFIFCYFMLVCTVTTSTRTSIFLICLYYKNYCSTKISTEKDPPVAAGGLNKNWFLSLSTQHSAQNKALQTLVSIICKLNTASKGRKYTPMLHKTTGLSSFIAWTWHMFWPQCPRFTNCYPFCIWQKLNNFFCISYVSCHLIFFNSINWMMLND